MTTATYTSMPNLAKQVAECLEKTTELKKRMRVHVL